MEVVPKENQHFCAILQGCLISFFDGNFKIHCIKMYLSIEGLRQIIFSGNVKCQNLSFVRFDIVDKLLIIMY